MEDQIRKLPLTPTTEDKPIPMFRREEKVEAEYMKVHVRALATTEEKDEQAAIYSSMCENSLGPTASAMPSWIDPKKATTKLGNPENTDLASVHLQRAVESGNANVGPIITTTSKEQNITRIIDSTARIPECQQELLKMTTEVPIEENSDLASIHFQRAVESGAANASPIITKTDIKHGKPRSGSLDSAASAPELKKEDQLQNAMQEFQEKVLLNE